MHSPCVCGPCVLQTSREAYNLSIVAAPPAGAAQITIHSATVLGLRHALRTLADLVSSSSVSVPVSSLDSGGAALPAVVIRDRPRFGYRGLILDTSHHFLSVVGLLNTVALLGRLKYNVSLSLSISLSLSLSLCLYARAFVCVLCV